MNKTVNFTKCKMESAKYRFLFIFLFVFCCSLISTERCFAAYAYAIKDGETLTFFYDNQFFTRWDNAGSSTWKKPHILIDDPSINSLGAQYKDWAFSYGNAGYYGLDNVKTVVFDVSFNDYNSLKTCLNWFCGFKALTTINGLEYLHPENVDNIHGMFADCALLTVDIIKTILSKFDFSKITDMGSLFLGCSFESFNFSEINNNKNTAIVTDMSWMFAKCENLKSINLESLNTQSVTTMNSMFSGCKSLEQINVGNFNTANVKDMAQMFYTCESLKSISGMDASRFNTSKVTTMESMFSGCKSLTSLTASGLETNKVTNMSSMFANCSTLTKLDLSNFVTTLVDRFDGMFQGCTDLVDLNISNFNTDNVDKNHASAMFQGCKSIETIDLSSFSKIDGYNAFLGCENLKTIKLPDNGIVLTSSFIIGMFMNCKSIEYVDFSGFKITNNRDNIQMLYTFQNCTNLVSVDLTSFEGAEVTSLYNLFDGCSNLATVLVPNNWIEPTKYVDDQSVFLGCNQIIGDKGTRYSADHIKYDYAIIDGGESSPAYFTADKYKVFYENTDGATFSTNNPIEFDKKLSSDITIVNPVKKGYTFLGWTGTSASGISETEPKQDVKIFKGSVGNRIYTANWKINKYTITFVTDGGTEIAAITQDFNTALTKPADPTKEGYTFTGWDKQIPQAMPDYDMTITAQWEKIPGVEYYNITFLDDDGKTVLSTIEYALDAPVDEYKPTKEGYDFVGWKEGELPKTMPAKDITFTAQWEKQLKITAIVVELNLDMEGNITFPKNTDKYCDGEENTVLIPYTVKTGKVTGYTVSFKDEVIPNIQATVKTDDEPNIVINIPSTLQSGVYQGSVVFSGDNKVYSNSEEYSFTLTVHLPEHLAVQVYTDVLVANNHDKRFESYQWYKNDSELPGATLQFYSEPKFSGSYKVKLTGKEGSVMSCPLVFGGTTKNLAQSVSVYPNPANSGEAFTIDIEQYDPAFTYDIVIFSANGSLVKKLSHVEKTTKVSLPFGVYSGSLINNGNKTGFKVIVK